MTGGGTIVLLGSRVPPPIADHDDERDNDDNKDDGTGIHSASSSSCFCSANASDDLASLQSIDDEPTGASSPRNDTEPLERQEQQEQQEQTLITRGAERTLLAAIGTSDPTSALLEHYQSLGKGGGKSRGGDKPNNSQPKQPTYRDVQHRDERGITTGWWRSALHCPVMDREYPSGLPWSVWLARARMSDVDNTKGGDDTHKDWEVILARLGETKIFDDGLVHFKSKKGARKAAAIAAYEANLLGKSRNSIDVSDHLKGISNGQVMFSSKAEAFGAISSSGAPGALLVGDKHAFEISPQAIAPFAPTNITVPATKPTAPAEPTKRVGHARRSHYPEWVNRLSRLGVTASSINIKFREYSPTQPKWADIKYISRDCPTELCAAVDVSSPFRFSTSSLPSVSRAEALKSMSVLVEEEARRLNVQVLSETDVGWEIKEGLLRSAPDKTATFHFPPPPCFTVSIDEKAHRLVAYEMVFTSKSGEDFVSSAMGLSPRVCSRMALVFGQDFHCRDKASSDAVNTTIEIPTRSGNEKVNLALRRRTVIDMGGNDDSLRKMRHFNTIVKDWKRYGFVGYSRSRGSVKLKGPMKFQDDNRTKGDRSCMFVPLREDDGSGEILIDWDLMTRVVQYNVEPYFFPKGLVGGRVESQHISFIIGLSTFSVASVCYQWLRMEEPAVVKNALDYYWTKLFVANSVPPVIYPWLACICLAFFFLSISPPKKTVDDEVLVNRFLTQSVGMSGIFVLNISTWLSGSTRNALATFDDKEDGKQSSHPTSCYEIYSERYSTKLRYAKHSLIPAKLVKKHAKMDLLSSQESTCTSKPIDGAGDTIHLPPELVHILPCPRDILYLCGQYFETILVSLERTVTLSNVDRRLQELEKKNGHFIAKTADRTNTLLSSHLLDNLDEGDFPLVLLDKATGLFPSPMYQRLEFLGDAILNHTLAINLFAKNSDLRLDADELGDKISVEMNNKQLGHAALRVGIPKILGVGGSTSRECSQGTLSDVVEALIAVAFIRNPAGSSVVGLFTELELSFSALSGENAAKGFVASSPCFIGPYPFDSHQNWNEQIVAVGSALAMDRHIDEKLERGFASLCNILDSKCSLRSQLSSPRTQILLRCALFDASLTGDTEGGTAGLDDKSLMSASPLEGLNMVGICRDNLFFIGNYALNLCLSIELYKRFPAASPKDLTLLTFCAFTDEAMAYVLTKNDLAQCLFDKDAPSVTQFWLEMKLADKRGMEIWEENDGWLFGIDEYRRRMKNEIKARQARQGQVRGECHRVDGDAGAIAGTDFLHPQYPGLGGGLLVGHLKKLDKGLTEDLAFSIKAICGALVLSFGVDGMWSVMGNFFTELLILTPEENQQLFSKNSVCQGWK